jgi:hypothetical protein
MHRTSTHVDTKALDRGPDVARSTNSGPGVVHVYEQEHTGPGKFILIGRAGPDLADVEHLGNIACGPMCQSIQDVYDTPPHNIVLSTAMVAQNAILGTRPAQLIIQVPACHSLLTCNRALAVVQAFEYQLVVCAYRTKSREPLERLVFRTIIGLSRDRISLHQ